MKKKPVIWRLIFAALKYEAISLCQVLISDCHSCQTRRKLDLSRFDFVAEVTNQFRADLEKDIVRKAFVHCSDLLDAKVNRSRHFDCFGIKWRNNASSFVKGKRLLKKPPVRMTPIDFNTKTFVRSPTFIQRNEQWIKLFPRNREKRVDGHLWTAKFSFSSLDRSEHPCGRKTCHTHEWRGWRCCWGINVQLEISTIKLFHFEGLKEKQWR